MSSLGTNEPYTTRFRRFRQLANRLRADDATTSAAASPVQARTFEPRGELAADGPVVRVVTQREAETPEFAGAKLTSNA